MWNKYIKKSCLLNGWVSLRFEMLLLPCEALGSCVVLKLMANGSNGSDYNSKTCLTASTFSMLQSSYLRGYSSQTIADPSLFPSRLLSSRCERGWWTPWLQPQWWPLKIERRGPQRRDPSWEAFSSLQRGSCWTWSACNPNSNLCLSTSPEKKKKQENL